MVDQLVRLLVECGAITGEAKARVEERWAEHKAERNASETYAGPQSALAQSSGSAGHRPGFEANRSAREAAEPGPRSKKQRSLEASLVQVTCRKPNPS